MCRHPQHHLDKAVDGGRAEFQDQCGDSMRKRECSVEPCRGVGANATGTPTNIEKAYARSVQKYELSAVLRSVD